MARTLFVNPSYANPRRKRRKKSKRRSYGRRKANRSRKSRRRVAYRGTVLLRRNAGITPFVQANPLILSNPRKRRRRRKNPLAMPSVRHMAENALSGAAGAIAALTINTVGLSKIDHKWGRRASQAGSSVVGGALIASKSPTMGAAYMGAAMVPLLQDLAADLLGVGVAAGVASKEADLDALAADLEDVLDDMDDGEGFSDDDDEDVW